ncbi:MAG: FKBP-type peptidyl-prolyl cis-trans isomerase [Muribaculaceae bacterium]
MAEKEFDKLSYALGLNVGLSYQQSGITKLNIQDFADGVAAIFNGVAPRLTMDEAREQVNKLAEELQRKHQEQEAKMAELNKKSGESFLRENGKRVEVKTTPSGLQYEVIAEGKGARPTATDQVEVHYTGKLLDGTVFDSSVERGEPITFPVSGVIPGWVEALQMMNEGSKWRLFIPSNLAYGAQGAGPIGPHQTLIFDVELLKVIKK